MWNTVSNVILKPLEGLEWKGQLISLGASKKEVERVMGSAEVVRNSFYYFDSELRFDFNRRGKLEFIEFLGGTEGKVKPMLYGKSVFSCLAEEIKELLEEKNGAKAQDLEQGHSYCFLNLSVGIYREITPSDVAEMIEEMKADGVPTEGNEDLEQDKRRANHWATIGIGIPGYYRK